MKIPYDEMSTKSKTAIELTYKARRIVEECLSLLEYLLEFALSLQRLDLGFEVRDALQTVLILILMGHSLIYYQ